MAIVNEASSPSFSTLSSLGSQPCCGRYEKEATILLSWGYWFSSRSLGLLSHPYITVRQIVRERFLRPLVIMPVVWWILSWLVAMVVGRVGLLFDLDQATWTIYVGRILVFGWVWGTIFLAFWQVVLGYLYVRFRGL